MSRSPAPTRRGATHPPQPVPEVDEEAILSAMARITCKQGFQSVRVAQIVAAAGVSRPRFYELFASREACFLAVFDQAVKLAGERVIPAYEVQDGWADRLSAGLAALVSFLDAEPELAKLCVIHSLQAGSATLARRNELLRTLTKALDEGRNDRAARAQLSPSIAKVVVSGMLGVIDSRLREPDERQLTTVVSPLMFMAVLPYLGLEAARRELFRPVVQAPRSNAEVDGDPPELG